VSGAKIGRKKVQSGKKKKRNVFHVYGGITCANEFLLGVGLQLPSSEKKKGTEKKGMGSLGGTSRKRVGGRVTENTGRGERLGGGVLRVAEDASDEACPWRQEGRNRF